MSDSKNLTIFDYMASSMLAVFVVWFWAQTANAFPKFFENTHPAIITITSYVFYILGGTIVSYLVAEKTQSTELTTGLRIGFVSSLVSTVYFYLSSRIALNFFVALLFSFTFGGYLGFLIFGKYRARIEPATDLNLSESDDTIE